MLDAPDNLTLTVRPRGGLAVCEDGDAEQYVRGLTQQSGIFDFALNLENDREFAGTTFSPDGETLFVNIQTPGRTFAIWGSREEGAHPNYFGAWDLRAVTKSCKLPASKVLEASMFTGSAPRLTRTTRRSLLSSLR